MKQHSSKMFYRFFLKNIYSLSAKPGPGFKNIIDIVAKLKNVLTEVLFDC